MPEPASPSLPEKATAVAVINIGRLWTLSIISLTLNLVILVLIVIGVIVHHRPMPGNPPCFMRDGGGFDRGDRPGWGRPGGDNRGFGRGPGMMGGPGGKPDPAKMADMVMNRLSQKLALTDDEKAKIKPIIDEQVADFQKQKEAQRAAMQKQIEDAKAKIKPLLTADQQKQLDAMPMPGGPKPPPSDGPPPPEEKGP